jgi:hypothetical protein
MRRFLLGAAALIAATIVLMPDDASAYWRGPGWGGYRLAGWGGYRPVYGPWVGAPVPRVAPLVVSAPAPIVVSHPLAYGYAPYPFYGGYYGYYCYGYGPCGP